MVAELVPTIRPSLPLLLPPDKPAPGARRAYGWRWTTCRGQDRALERRHQDDVHGAIVQWCVLRYYRDGVMRKTLAAEYGYSERQIQEYLTGKARADVYGHWYTAYAAPVLRALARLGFPTDEASNKRKRAEVQVRAARSALKSAAELLHRDARVAARRLVHDVALLTVEAPS